MTGLRPPLFLAVALMLGGCTAQSFLGEQEAPQLYVLRADLGDLSGPAADFALAVAEPDAPAALNSPRIAVQRSPETMDYYADASWQDRAPVLLQRALIEGFEKSGRIHAVARDVDGLKADYQLQIDLRRYEAAYAAPDAAPTVVVEIGLRLMKLSTRNVVASTVIATRRIADANTVAAAVAAFDAATGAAVDEAVTWTLSAPNSK